jgi:hypothetical protein
VGNDVHLIEDNSPGAPHYITGGYSLGARIGSELMHVLLAVIGKNPDTDSARLGGWLGAWQYLGRRMAIPGC